MKKNKFMSLMLVFILFLSAILTGCGAKKEKQVTLRFIIGNDEPHLMAAIEEFEKENPNIKIEVETIPWKQFFEKVETMIAGGRMPDLLYTPVLATGRYIELDLLLDITSSLTDEEKNDYIQSAMITAEKNGRIYGLPHFTDDIAIFYNKNYFEKAGVKVPSSLDKTWTWEEFLNAAEKVKKVNKLKYGVTTGNDISQFLPFLYQNKATVLNETQTAAGINSQEGIEAIAWFKSWFDRGLASKEVFVGSENAEELFKQGQVPMLVSFSGLISSLREQVKDFEFGVTYMPKKETVANKLGGYNIVAFKNTKYPEEAIKFMKFITNPEQMAKFASAKGVVPTRKSAQNMVNYGDMQEGMKVIIDEINAVPDFAVKDFALPQYLGYKSILTSEIQMVVLGQKTPEQAAKSIEEQINSSVFK